MRMTNPEGKNVAGWYVDFKTSSSTYRPNPLAAFFQGSKKAKAKAAGEAMIKAAKDAGAVSAEAKLVALYRDETSGRFLPGRGVVSESISYSNGRKS
jgi:hypothetical protein